MSHRPYPHRQRALHQIRRHPAPRHAATAPLGGILSTEAAANIAAFVAAMRSYDFVDAAYAARPKPTIGQRLGRLVSSAVGR